MSDNTPEQALLLVRLGVAAGVATCLVYPAVLLLPLSHAGAATLAAAWGPLLGIASIGLGKILQAERTSVPAQLGVLFNFAAGVLVSTMLLVQIAVGARVQGGKVAPELVGVWLGLDVAWDVYVGIGTALFALAMFRHPRFRATFALSGLAIAAILLVLNLVTFPTPPADANLFDAGPLVGLWYLAVSIQVWRSLGWAKTAFSANAGARRPGQPVIRQATGDRQDD